jgi:DNA-directed RNA polymerase subunit RPC12/RpoP
MASLTKKPIIFECMECGRKFRSVEAARRATDHGCPKCGGSDIDMPRITEEFITFCDGPHGVFASDGAA